MFGYVVVQGGITTEQGFDQKLNLAEISSIYADSIVVAVAVSSSDCNVFAWELF